MLKRLYGPGRMGHPNIAYPKIHAKTKEEKRAVFIPGGASADARDPRTEKKKVVVAAPRRVKESREVFAIDGVRRRRASAVIEEQLAGLRRENEAYRPARTRASSTEAEKMRLQEKFQFGGGKALPEEMLQGAGPIPSEARQAEREQKRVQKEWQARRGLSQDVRPETTEKTDVRTNLIDHISDEIQDRQNYLNGLKALGQKPNDNTRHIQLEIDLRHNELQQLLSSSSSTNNNKNQSSSG